MDDCIFCKIGKGEIPAEKVYEDDQTFGFVDLHPIRPGHLLIIPKKHFTHFEQMDEDTYTHIFSVVKKAAQHITEVLQPVRVCQRIEGFDVNHVHIQRIHKEPDHPALAAMAARLKF